MNPSLAQLDDDALLAEVKRLVQCERETTAYDAAQVRTFLVTFPVAAIVPGPEFCGANGKGEFICWVDAIHALNERSREASVSQDLVALGIGNVARRTQYWARGEAGRVV